MSQQNRTRAERQAPRAGALLPEPGTGRERQWQPGWWRV
ncbi:hypothetical protein J3R08_003513 [Micromonospora sp. HB375]|nr:hypothetical protein [Micromonospora sp. HB375]MDH6472288.1 hypothetical protein [Micromonospora sp. H404/HB375]